MGKLRPFIIQYLPKRTVSILIGNISRVRNRAFQKFLISRFIKKYRVDISEISKPVDEYETLLTFFTRELKDGSRKIENNRIISPVDGIITEIGKISNGVFCCKGEELSISELVGDEEFMSELKGGYYSIHYLSPGDYHWIHSPVEGKIYRIKRLAGSLYPVFDDMITRKKDILCINERLNVFIRSDGFNICVSMIAAMGVGNIILSDKFRSLENTNQSLFEEIAINKGEKLAVFALGSTVVLAFNNIEPKLDLKGNHVKYGIGISKI